MSGLSASCTLTAYIACQSAAGVVEVCGLLRLAVHCFIRLPRASGSVWTKLAACCGRAEASNGTLQLCTHACSREPTLPPARPWCACLLTLSALLESSHRGPPFPACPGEAAQSWRQDAADTFRQRALQLGLDSDPAACVLLAAISSQTRALDSLWAQQQAR